MAKRIEDLLALSFSAKGVKVLNINQSAFRVAMHGGARSETAVGMTS